VLAQGRGGGLTRGGIADEDGDGRADATGEREQFERGLPDRAVRVVDENENFRHSALLFLRVCGRWWADGSDELLVREPVDELLPAVAFIRDDFTGGAAGSRRQFDDLRERTGAAGGGIEAQSAQVVLRDGLLLRLHDPLEGGVAGLVDLVRDGHERWQVHLDELRGGVAVAADGRGRVRDLERGTLRRRGTSQQLGDHGGHDGHLAVRGGQARDDEVHRS